MITHSRRYGAIAPYFPPDAVCHLCGEPVSPRHYGHAADHGEDTVTLDHLTPQSHGESETVLPAHLRCNSFRGAAPVDVARLLLRRGRPKIGDHVRVAVLAERGSIGEIAARLGLDELAVAEAIYVATQSAGWKPVERARAVAMLASGVPPRHVAERTGRGRKAVYKLAQAIKLPEHAPSNRTDPYTDDEISTVIELRERGATQRQIAAELGRSYKSVGKLLARLRKRGA